MSIITLNTIVILIWTGFVVSNLWLWRSVCLKIVNFQTDTKQPPGLHLGDATIHERFT